jgi:hypothetical protein
MVFRLLHEEGFFVGASSALNVCAAVQLAKILGPGKTIVTILCDGGNRHLFISLIPKDNDINLDYFLKNGSLVKIFSKFFLKNMLRVFHNLQ